MWSIKWGENFTLEKKLMKWKRDIKNLEKILYLKKNFWDENAIYKIWKKICTAKELLRWKIKWRKFYIGENISKMKMRYKNLKKILQMWKICKSKMKYIKFGKDFILGKKLLRRKYHLKNLKKISLWACLEKNWLESCFVG